MTLIITPNVRFVRRHRAAGHADGADAAAADRHRDVHPPAPAVRGGAARRVRVRGVRLRPRLAAHPLVQRPDRPHHKFPVRRGDLRDRPGAGPGGQDHSQADQPADRDDEEDLVGHPLPPQDTAPEAVLSAARAARRRGVERSEKIIWPLLVISLTSPRSER